MTTQQQYISLIAKSIWRAGFIKDKNKIRQQSRESMRKLIANQFIGYFRGSNDFNENEFLKQCGIS